MKSFYPKTLKKYDEKIGFVAEKLGEKTVVELERFATALYVTLESKNAENSGKRALRIAVWALQFAKSAGRTKPSGTAASTSLRSSFSHT